MTQPTHATPDRAISAMSGSAALPRRNGELVFAEPWEGRAFGLAVALNENGAYDWPDAWFRFWSVLVHVLVWATLVATVGSGVTYVTKARELFTEEAP